MIKFNENDSVDDLIDRFIESKNDETGDGMKCDKCGKYHDEKESCKESKDDDEDDVEKDEEPEVGECYEHEGKEYKCTSVTESIITLEDEDGNEKELDKDDTEVEPDEDDKEESRRHNRHTRSDKGKKHHIIKHHKKHPRHGLHRKHHKNHMSSMSVGEMINRVVEGEDPKDIVASPPGDETPETTEVNLAAGDEITIDGNPGTVKSVDDDNIVITDDKGEETTISKSEVDVTDEEEPEEIEKAKSESVKKHFIVLKG